MNEDHTPRLQAFFGNRLPVLRAIEICLCRPICEWSISVLPFCAVVRQGRLQGMKHGVMMNGGDNFEEATVIGTLSRK
jgi:hypothetical protein